jgi:beta-lactamase class D
MNRFCFLFSLIFAFSIAESSAAEPVVKEAPELAELFETENVTGTFVLFDVSANVRHVYNLERAAKRFLPASTFKIPNTLIGLTTGAVKNVDEVLPYGGKPQFLPQFEQDLSLRDAIRISSVPIYQELARRITLEKMAESVKKLDYGNREIGTKVDQFWLEGPLRISPIEQTGFLVRLAKSDLPFPAEAISATHEITLLEKTPTTKLHGKTGWAGSVEPTGWFVGWVEKNDNVYAFALNIDMDKMETAPKRISLTKACLKKFGVLE